MATQASSGDGTKNTRHHPVSLVKQFFPCCQTHLSCQRWSNASCQAYGLARTQHPMRISLEFPTRLFEHEQPEDFQQLMDVINRSPTLLYTTGGPYISKPPPVYKPLRSPAAAEADAQTFESGATTQQRATTNHLNSEHNNRQHRRCTKTCHSRLTNGNSTNKLSHKTITSITKPNSCR